MSNVKQNVKETVTDESLQDYIANEFRQRVLKFNAVCGKGLPEKVRSEDLVLQTIEQGDRVLEECVEALSAYLDNNAQERLDGLVDILVTETQLRALIELLEQVKHENKGLVELAFSKFNPDDYVHLNEMGKLVTSSIAIAIGVNKFTPKRIKIACDLILDNNDQKWTTDLEKAKDWERNISEEGVVLLTTEYEGVNHYSLRRLSDRKVMKPYNFVAVKLDYPH
jgi:hypothetical protein